MGHHAHTTKGRRPNDLQCPAPGSLRRSHTLTVRLHCQARVQIRASVMKISSMFAGMSRQRGITDAPGDRGVRLGGARDQAEQRRQQQQRRSGGPCLRSRGGRERDRHRRQRRREAGEHLGQAMLEVGRRGQRSRRRSCSPPRDGRSGPGRRRSASSRGARRSRCGSRAGCSRPRARRACGRPSRSRAARRAAAPAVGGCLVLVEQPRPQQVADVGGQAVDLTLVAVERERVTAALGHPEVASEARRADPPRAARVAPRARGRPIPRARGAPSAAARRRRSPGSRRSRSVLARACRRRTGSSSSCPSSTG